MTSPNLSITITEIGDMPYNKRFSLRFGVGNTGETCDGKVVMIDIDTEETLYTREYTFNENARLAHSAYLYMPKRNFHIRAEVYEKQGDDFVFHDSDEVVVTLISAPGVAEIVGQYTSVTPGEAYPGDEVKFKVGMRNNNDELQTIFSRLTDTDTGEVLKLITRNSNPQGGLIFSYYGSMPDIFTRDWHVLLDVGTIIDGVYRVDASRNWTIVLLDEPIEPKASIKLKRVVHPPVASEGNEITIDTHTSSTRRGIAFWRMIDTDTDEVLDLYEHWVRANQGHVNRWSYIMPNKDFNMKCEVGAKYQGEYLVQDTREWTVALGEGNGRGIISPYHTTLPYICIVGSAVHMKVGVDNDSYIRDTIFCKTIDTDTNEILNEIRFELDGMHGKSNWFYLNMPDKNWNLRLDAGHEASTGDVVDDSRELTIELLPPIPSGPAPLPHNKNVLFIRPNHDVATDYGAYWLRKCMLYAQELGYNAIDLVGTDATTENVFAAIENSNPVYISNIGHGCSHITTCYNNEHMFYIEPGCEGKSVDSTNVDKLHGSIYYALSCSCGKYLIPKIHYDGGAVASLGYDIVFTFIVDTSKPKDEDMYALGFEQMCNAIPFSLLTDSTVEEAYIEHDTIAQSWIEYWEQSDDPLAPYIISFLLLDKNGLVKYGYDGGKIKMATEDIVDSHISFTINLIVDEGGGSILGHVNPDGARAGDIVPVEINVENTGGTDEVFCKLFVDSELISRKVVPMLKGETHTFIWQITMPVNKINIDVDAGHEKDI